MKPKKERISFLSERSKDYKQNDYYIRYIIQKEKKHENSLGIEWKRTKNKKRVRQKLYLMEWRNQAINSRGANYLLQMSKTKRQRMNWGRILKIKRITLTPFSNFYAHSHKQFLTLSNLPVKECSKIKGENDYSAAATANGKRNLSEQKTTKKTNKQLFLRNFYNVILVKLESWYR